MCEILSAVQRTLARNMLRFHAGHEIFCPKCHTILDCKRAVEIDVCKQDTDATLVRSYIMCANCWETRYRVDIESLNRNASVDSRLLRAKIWDGRELFSAPAKTDTSSRPSRYAIHDKDVTIGARYEIHHTSGYITVRVERTRVASSGRTHYVCLNERTGRTIEVKSANKFRPLAKGQE